MKARFFPAWEANILGGSLDQSKKAYQATMNFWRATDDINGRDVLAEEPLISETRFKNGSRYGISTASTRSVRGPHPHCLFLDEIDEMDIEVFNAAMLQPQGDDRYKASWAFTSTWHRADGIMADWINNASARNFKLYKWCILEVMEGCYDYSCSTCNKVLEEQCQGKMKQAMELAESEQLRLGIILPGEPARMGFNSVEDVIAKIESAFISGSQHRISSIIDIDAELFCRKPRRTGLVYSDFDPNIHVIQPFNIPETWVRYRAFDFGFTNPWACVYVAYDKARDIYFIYDELYELGKSTRDLIPVLTDGIKYELQVGDVACPDDIHDLNKAGIATVAYKQAIADGIKRIRRLLKRRVDGNCGLYVFNSCTNTIKEFLSYRYNDQTNSENPIDENNHALSALRYLIFALEYGETVLKHGVLSYD